MILLFEKLLHLRNTENIQSMMEYKFEKLVFKISNLDLVDLLHVYKCTLLKY